ncbi:MAG TPA: radical SAM protein, partial [Vicinamibacteria bacterium]|nr:radical SAM protein [Vicinamibacteria bacterium]
MSAVPPASGFPSAPLLALDTLWFQVAGTLCNIQCAHCFISSSPANRSHEMLSLETVERALAEAEALGVREYYFTGGEPFMNREIVEILEAALALGPV